MAKSIRFTKGSEVYTLDPSGVTAKTGTKKSLNALVSNLETLYLGTISSNTSEQYYLIASLGKNNNDDASNIRIIGNGGGWVGNTMASFDLTYSSRGNTGYGVWYGNANGWNYFDIRVYQGTDGVYRVYLHRKGVSFIGCLELITMGGYASLNCLNTPVSPNGTLVKTFDNTNLTKIG